MILVWRVDYFEYKKWKPTQPLAFDIWIFAATWDLHVNIYEKSLPGFYDMHFYLPNLNSGSEFSSWGQTIGSTWVSKSFEWVHKHCAPSYLYENLLSCDGRWLILLSQMTKLRHKMNKYPSGKASRWSSGLLSSRGEAHSPCYLSSKRSMETQSRFLNKCIRWVKKNNQRHARSSGCVKNIKNKKQKPL